MVRANIHIPFRPLQDADDPAATTHHLAVDHGGYRVPTGQVDQCAAGPAGRIWFHAPIIEVRGDGPGGGISKRVDDAAPSASVGHPRSQRYQRQTPINQRTMLTRNKGKNQQPDGHHESL